MLELNSTNFESEVTQTSYQLPVLVDFWADWCAPCKMLAPVLEKLAQDYDGRLRIAKVNTDQERGLAQEHGIRSLPTLRLYRNGEVVEEVLGAQPESTLRALLENHLERPSDATLQAALTHAQAGDPERAVELLEQACADDPQNPRLPLALARLYIDSEQFDKASGFLQGLPHELRESDEGKSLQLLLEFTASSAGSPDSAALERQLADDPGNAQARHQLASRQLTAGDYDNALENFLELLKRDRKFGDGAAQRGLLAVFSLLGEDDPRVGTYRRKMFTLLH